MRIFRLSMLVLTMAVAAAGCARQPVAYQPALVAPAPASIDSMTYGPMVAPAPVAVPVAGRGLPVANFMGPRRLAVAPPAPVFAATGSVAAPPALAYAPVAAEGPYTLDSGDRLRIVVFGQEGLTNSYAVDASGHIDMPLIGSVSARGATTEELSFRIAEQLRQGFIREPHVAVEIEAYRPFFILGEVTAPGQYPFVANMSVETAVAIAGGFAPRAFRRTVIVNRYVHGQQLRMNAPLNFPLRPGDTVNVQERWF